MTAGGNVGRIERSGNAVALGRIALALAGLSLLGLLFLVVDGIVGLSQGRAGEDVVLGIAWGSFVLAGVAAGAAGMGAMVVGVKRELRSTFRHGAIAAAYFLALLVLLYVLPLTLTSE